MALEARGSQWRCRSVAEGSSVHATGTMGRVRGGGCEWITATISQWTEGRDQRPPGPSPGPPSSFPLLCSGRNTSTPPEHLNAVVSIRMYRNDAQSHERHQKGTGVELATASEPPARKPRIWASPSWRRPQPPLRCNVLLNHALIRTWFRVR